MSNTISSICRAASIGGATGLTTLSLAGPTSARPDSGTGSAEEQRCSVLLQGSDYAAPAILTPAFDGNGIEVPTQPRPLCTSRVNFLITTLVRAGADGGT